MCQGGNPSVISTSIQNAKKHLELEYECEGNGGKSILYFFHVVSVKMTLRRVFKAAEETSL